jgi:hypothetical protein
MTTWPDGDGSMNKRVSALLFSTALLSASMGSGCFNLPTLRFDPPFGSSNWVEFQDSVVITGFSPGLGATIVNLKNKKISVRVEIDEIEGGGDCANSLSFGPLEKLGYLCPQPLVRVGNRYRVDVRVYKDWGETKTVERLQRAITIEKDNDGGLILVGRPLD